MTTDFASLMIAWLALRIAWRPATWTQTYGLDRVGILAAFVNGLSRFGIFVWIAVEAIQRLQSPSEVLGGTKLWLAILGLVVNLVAFWKFSRANGANLNLRAAGLHVAVHALGTVAPIIAALVILFDRLVSDRSASVGLCRARHPAVGMERLANASLPAQWRKEGSVPFRTGTLQSKSRPPVLNCPDQTRLTATSTTEYPPAPKRKGRKRLCLSSGNSSLSTFKTTPPARNANRNATATSGRPVEMPVIQPASTATARSHRARWSYRSL